jgi:hypothetical protein
MKSSTSPLKALCSARLPDNRLNIHPNEGADIGLMMTKHSARFADGGEVELHLLNECPKESVELSSRLWEKLGKPAKVRLGYEDGTLSIEPA